MVKINEELNKINILNTKELIDNYNEKVISEESEEGVSDKTLEHDLFNLIDSMYEEKKGE